MNQSEIVHKRVVSLFEVAEITNDGKLPEFIVLPEADIMALKQHKRAMDWLQFDLRTNRITIYGVRIEAAERIAYLRSMIDRTARRLERIDHAMRRHTKDGVPLMRREALLIASDEMLALEQLARLDRRHEQFDLPRGLFRDVHRFEVGDPSAIRQQNGRADVALMMRTPALKKWIN